MNKVIFNEGGQPVFLDDLELLQELSLAQIGGIVEPIMDGSTWPVYEYSTGFKNLFPVGTGSLVGCFVSLNLTAYGRNDTTRVAECHFRAGYVYVNGELLKYDAATLNLSYGVPFYVIVKKEYAEQRTLDNGSAAYCKETKRAVLSASPSTTDECYSSAQIGDLMDSIYNLTWIRMRQAARNWTTISFTGANGFSGVIKYCYLPDCIRYNIVLTSSASGDASLNSSYRIALASGTFPGDPNNSPIMFVNGRPCYLEFLMGSLYLRFADGSFTSVPYSRININTTFDIPIEKS